MIAIRRSAGPPAHEKAQITLARQRFIDEVLKPRFLPAIRPTHFNYPIDILGKWHGNRYRFMQRYKSGFPENLGEEFDSPFTRLDWMGRDRFDIQRRRHTETWFCLYRGLSLKEALKTIETDGLLHHIGGGIGIGSTFAASPRESRRARRNQSRSRSAA